MCLRYKRMLVQGFKIGSGKAICENDSCASSFRRSSRQYESRLSCLYHDNDQQIASKSE